MRGASRTRHEGKGMWIRYCQGMTGPCLKYDGVGFQSLGVRMYVTPLHPRRRHKSRDAETYFGSELFQWVPCTYSHLTIYWHQRTRNNSTKKLPK